MIVNITNYRSFSQYQNAGKNFATNKVVYA